MAHHLKVCKRKDTCDGQILMQQRILCHLVLGVMILKICELLILAIIMRDLPFQFVEYEGIKAFLQFL